MSLGDGYKMSFGTSQPGMTPVVNVILTQETPCINPSEIPVEAGSSDDYFYRSQAQIGCKSSIDQTYWNDLRYEKIDQIDEAEYLDDNGLWAIIQDTQRRQGPSSTLQLNV